MATVMKSTSGTPKVPKIQAASFDEDPWDNDEPITFRSPRRDSHAKRESSVFSGSKSFLHRDSRKSKIAKDTNSDIEFSPKSIQFASVFTSNPENEDRGKGSGNSEHDNEIQAGRNKAGANDKRHRIKGLMKYFLVCKGDEAESQVQQ